MSESRRATVLPAAAAVFFGAIAGALAALAFPSSASAAINCAGHHLNDMSTTAVHYGAGVNGTYGIYVFGNPPIHLHPHFVHPCEGCQ